jgi:hypothetical protein
VVRNSTRPNGEMFWSKTMPPQRAAMVQCHHRGHAGAIGEALEVDPGWIGAIGIDNILDGKLERSGVGAVRVVLVPMIAVPARVNRDFSLSPSSWIFTLLGNSLDCSLDPCTDRARGSFCPLR